MSSFVGFSPEFLQPYRERGDCFPNLLARIGYLTKYSRNGETWTDTVERVVRGNIQLDPDATQEEAEKLFQLVWEMKCLPPGRGLWTGGVDGIPPEARYNCWYTTVRSTEDWCWTANQLMLGGGVGVGLLEIDKLPVVAEGDASLTILCDSEHPNFEECQPAKVAGFFSEVEHVADSREGWVNALRFVFAHAFSATSKNVAVDVSWVRERGMPIKTFGGIACGPAPLAAMLRAVWAIVRGAAGRKLTSVECLDITNHIGLCIKSGNVRRSALIQIGAPTDQAFRDAKKDVDAINSHRHTSNNSLGFQTWHELMDMDWDALVEDNERFGEPGVANLVLVRLTDPLAMGVNPCGEQFLHDREACNLGEVFPSLMDSEEERHLAFTLMTRYCIRQRLTALSDPQSEAVRRRTMRIGVAIGGLCDFDWTPAQLKSYYDTVRMESAVYAKGLNVNAPLTCTTVKPSGTISLLNGSSPGIHAPFAPFYVRRVRIPVNDPMASAIIAAGVPYEYAVGDEKMYVFSFPMKKPGRAFYVSTETIRDQIVRQVTVQECWADNAVSATLSFEDHEKVELAKCLKEFMPRLKSTSCLPKAHGYAQAPYEEITEEEYERMNACIDHTSHLVQGGELEIEECAGGVCPVR